MKKIVKPIFALLVLPVPAGALAQAQNPLIFADVPDMAMIRVGGNYYMSSTTMHMNGLFNYATKTTGGYADLDWFRVKY